MVGFPVDVAGHEQKAWWLDTEHSAQDPQDELKHGSKIRII